MGRYFFFIGRAERIVLIVLLLLISSGAVLLSLTSRGQSQMSVLASPADTIYRPDHYVGPPAHLRNSSAPKFRQRQILDLNTVDSLTLIRVPGIGPAFSHRILALRRQLGGYYTVLQLQEVYGMDEDKFLSLKGWFRIGRSPRTYRLDSLISGDIPRHPYLSYTQIKSLNRLIGRHGRIMRWSTLMRDPAFSRDDSIRLSPYFIETPKSLQ